MKDIEKRNRLRALDLPRKVREGDVLCISDPLFERTGHDPGSISELHCSIAGIGCEIRRFHPHILAT